MMSPQRRLDRLFDLGVHGTRGVVEGGRIRASPETCPGERDPLALAAGKVRPRSPTTVSYPRGSCSMSTSWASAARAAYSTSAPIGRPKAMFERTEEENRKLSSKTTPTWRRSDSLVTSRTSQPSKRTAPEFTS